jgi:predicted Rdx family selenoprotein
VPSSGGAFLVRFDSHVVFDYKKEHRFPEPKEVRETILQLTGKPPTPPRH